MNQSAKFADWVKRKVSQCILNSSNIRSATQRSQAREFRQYFSIHAPHTERDFIREFLTPANTSFNPRAPYGARPTYARIDDNIELFQSTRPIRSATRHIGMDGCIRSFQSTRPIRSATVHESARLHHTTSFNPRAPYGARLAVWSYLSAWNDVSIHAPHTERDCCTCT